MFFLPYADGDFQRSILYRKSKVNTFMYIFFFGKYILAIGKHSTQNRVLKKIYTNLYTIKCQISFYSD